MSFGESLFPGTSADGNGDGLVDAGDYTLWRDRFGTAVGTGAGSSQHSLQSIKEDAFGDAAQLGVAPIDSDRAAISAGASTVVAIAPSRASARDRAIARMKFNWSSNRIAKS